MVEAAIRMSFHALDRLDSRLSLIPKQVVEILESGKIVPIGTETGKTRTHYLFYSIPDRQCFVAVIDDKDGTVITVLPEDYHENLGWPISDESRKMAVGLSGEVQDETIEAVDVSVFTEEIVVPVKVVVASTAPSVFKISGGIRDENGNVKYTNLGSWPLEPYGGDVNNLIADQIFVDQMKDLSKRKASGTLILLCVKVGKRGDAGGIFHLKEA